jgi:ribonuclease BN (tRNA processing enzyme)
MNLTMRFLGSGSGLCDHRDNFHTNVLLTDSDFPGQHLMIDCGTHAQIALVELDIDVCSIDSIFVTHAHADHAGSLEWMALKRYFCQNSMRPVLIGDANMLNRLWRKTLSGGLETLQGKKNTLRSFFRVVPVARNGSFVWFNTKFDLVQTVHNMNERSVNPSYGLFFEVNGKKIFFTGDTQFCPNQILAFYEEADVIFQDCELAKYPQSVHAQFHELCTLPENIRQKMWLDHYRRKQDIPPDWQHYGFPGFVERYQTFTF